MSESQGPAAAELAAPDVISLTLEMILNGLGLDTKVPIRVRRTSKLESMFSQLVASRFPALDFSELRFVLQGSRLVISQTFEEAGIEDGDTVMCFRALKGRKPVIYLFPPNGTTITDASVKLSVVPEWSLSVVYPVVPIKPACEGRNEGIQWNVCVHSDGTLTEMNTGVDVAYLFWEAEANQARRRPASPPRSPVFAEAAVEAFNPTNAILHDSNSVVVPTKKVPAYLDASLKALGLHTEARTSFITYWLPFMLKHTHIALRFLPQASYSQSAPLDITPPPDIVTRVFMLFRGVEAGALDAWPGASGKADEDVRFWTERVGVDLERTLNRDLFRVVEWGGMEVL